jgi:hypothetical protein
MYGDTDLVIYFFKYFKSIPEIVLEVFREVA